MAAKNSSKPTKFNPLSKFSTLQALILVCVFALTGSIALYFTRATPLTWNQLTASYNCSTYYGVPPTMYPGDVRGCARMLKYILRTYGGVPNLTDDTTYGSGAVAAVKYIQTYLNINPVNKLGVVERGIVDPQTWVVIQNTYLKGSGQLVQTSPTPPPNAYIGVKPGFSGRLSAQDTDYFNQQWPKWNTAGWCVIGHESHAAGDYKTTTSSDGAFQIIPNTWGYFYGYPNANSAPADVQWVKFFYLYANGAGGSHWHGTFWMSYNIPNHINEPRFVSATGADLGAYQPAPYHPAGAVPCPNT